jgi:hypothetical protein
MSLKIIIVLKNNCGYEDDENLGQPNNEKISEH